MTTLRRETSEQATAREVPPLVLKERGWTYADLCMLPDDGLRYEVVEGMLHVAPAPSPNHQHAVGELFALMRENIRQSGNGSVWIAPIDVLLPGGDVVQPDVVYLAADCEAVVTERAIEGTPTLVIEVLSPATSGFDRSAKAAAYAKAGVQHYWLYSPRGRVLDAYVFSDGGYNLADRSEVGDLYLPELFPGMQIDIAAL